MKPTLYHRLNTLVDAAIYTLAPAWGARRAQARRINEAVSSRLDYLAGRITNRAYESAESDRTNAARWLGSRLSADAGLQMDQEMTRTRSRELSRNDFLGGTVESRIDHIVGTGFTVQSKIPAGPQFLDEESAKRINDQLEEVFAKVQSHIDVSRKKSLWQVTCLFAASLDHDGEALAVFSDVPNPQITDSDYDPELVRPLPLAVEIIDVDRLQTPPEKTMDPLCRMGVQYNTAKRIIGYWIRKTHPHDDKEWSQEFDFVAADRVCHAYSTTFAGASRGMPWAAPILNRAKDGKDLTEAGIIGAQAEACHAGFVQGSRSPWGLAMGMATGVDANGQRLQNIVPGTISYLGDNEQITFNTPTKTNSVGTLQEYNNRTISAGLNWPYEMMMKDWRGCSFAAGRIVLQGAKLSVRRRQKLVVESFLQPFWRRMVWEAVVLGLVEIDPRVYRDSTYRCQSHSWTAPKWSYALNPGEETDARVSAIDNNLATLADTLAEDQLDLEQVLPQRSRERQMERDLNCIPTGLLNAEAQRQFGQDATPAKGSNNDGGTQ